MEETYYVAGCVFFFFKLDVWCAINALIIRKFKKIVNYLQIQII